VPNVGLGFCKNKKTKNERRQEEGKVEKINERKG
jgi:hypothetical protein